MVNKIIENHLILTALLARHADTLKLDKPAHRIAEDVRALVVNTDFVQRMALLETNDRSMTEAEKEKEADCCKKIAQIAATYKLKANTGGDPRGYVVYLIGLQSNSMGGDECGYGIE